MNAYYEVFHDSKAVGSVSIEKQGLYYYLQCHCTIPKDERYMLTMICGTVEQNLGLCVPYETGIGLKTRIKASTIGECRPKFMLIHKITRPKGAFIPVFTDQPFDFLEGLETAVFQLRDNQPGILFLDQSSIDSSKPTGQ